MNSIELSASSRDGLFSDASQALASPGLAVPLSDPGWANSGRSASLLFIDTNVNNYQNLMADINPGTEVYVLDATQDAITQITQTLAGLTGITSLQILSHGAAGGLALGHDWVDVNDLDRYATQLQSWAKSLTEDADILLYGCDVAAGEIGQTFVQALAKLTGADVAASDDLTGNAALGGDWDLEVQTGAIAAPLAFSQTALREYAPTLGIIINEFQRSGTFATAEYIEFLLTSDYTATELQNLFFGDSNTTTSQKSGVYKFQNLASIATTFKAGTIIVAGGSTVVPTDEIIYNPIAGGTDDQWNLRLKFGSSYINNVSGTGDFAAAQDVAWVDSSSIGTLPPIYAIAYKTSGSYGLFGSVATVKLDAPLSATPVIQFNGNGTQTADPTKFSFAPSVTTLGAANGGDNSAYINALRNPSNPPTAQASSVTFNEDNIYSFKAADFSFSATSGSLQSVQITQLNTIGQLFFDNNSDNIQDAGEAILSNQTITLADIAKLKFKPAANVSGNNYANFRFKVSTDQLSATDAPMTVNVAAVNDAPILDNSGSPTFPSITQGVTNPNGVRVTDLIVSLGGTGISDVDLGTVKGIAITETANNNGTWQFSTNGGTTWANLDSVSDATATVLGATPLYSTTPGTAPDAQSWFSFNNLKTTGNPLLPFTTGNATQSANPNGTVLDTSANLQTYAGYTNYKVNNDLSQSLKNPAFPVLDRNQGYSLSFNLQVLQESHTNADRGFAVILLGQDKQGIELGFQFDGTNGRIFAQTLNGANQFVGAESIAFNTNALTAYTLTIQGNTYQLLANGTSVLTGTLRNYSAWVSPDAFPSPYGLANFVFLGDNTTSAQGIFNVGQIALQTDTRVRFVPNATYVGESKISFRAWDGSNGVANGTAGVNTLPSGGSTAFSTATQIAQINVQAPSAWSIVKTVDFDQDNQPDILWRNSTTGGAAIWKMNGTTFVAATALPVIDLDWQMAGVADFDKNGSVDILLRNSITGTTAVWLMDKFAVIDSVALPFADLTWQIAGLADFNQDGFTDILWRNQTTGTTALWQMNSTNVATSIALAFADSTWNIAGLGDLDGDGFVDILWRNQASGANAFWKMNGTTVQTAVALSATDSTWQVAGLADFDKNGTADILWRNTTTGSTAIWKLSGGANPVVTDLGFADLGFQVQAITDLDGDGFLDIIWRNPGTGNNAMWKLNGPIVNTTITLRPA